MKVLVDVVGEGGLEPPTSCTQSRCATTALLPGVSEPTQRVLQPPRAWAPRARSNPERLGPCEAGRRCQGRLTLPRMPVVPVARATPAFTSALGEAWDGEPMRSRLLPLAGVLVVALLSACSAREQADEPSRAPSDTTPAPDAAPDTTPQPDAAPGPSPAPEPAPAPEAPSQEGGLQDLSINCSARPACPTSTRPASPTRWGARVSRRRGSKATSASRWRPSRPSWRTSVGCVSTTAVDARVPGQRRVRAAALQHRRVGVPGRAGRPGRSRARAARSDPAGHRSQGPPERGAGRAGRRLLRPRHRPHGGSGA